MSEYTDDIKDDEIEVIKSVNTDNVEQGRSILRGRSRNRFILAAAVFILLISAIVVIVFFTHSGNDTFSLSSKDTENTEQIDQSTNAVPFNTSHKVESSIDGHVDIVDTLINNIPLTIYKPVNLTPILHIGADILRGSDAKMVVQAADVRGDNGDIVGSFVLGGELISRGSSKAGFCAIIEGNPVLGVADVSPMLEKAIESEGYFFRQYPLVVGNQIVENKPKGRSFRKALAEWNRSIVVIMSQERLTFHDFSQALVDLGVVNAIYLVGSTSYGYAIDAEGHRIEFGQEVNNPSQNTNYMIWL